MSTNLIQKDVEEKELTEALSVAQRMKKKRTMRRLKPRIQRGARKAKVRTASQSVINRRAKKRAQNAMFKKMAKKSRSKASYSQRKQVEVRLARRKGAIERMARKLRRQVRSDERNRRHRKSANK